MLLNVVGTHKILLKRGSELGKEIYFKSTLWYPFNYAKVDKLMHDLRHRIKNAKAQPDNAEPNRLQSFN